MIRHLVVWRIAAEDPEQKAADAAAAAARLGALAGVVPGIRSLTVGPNVAYPDSNWDLGLVVDVDTIADLEAYQAHPAHQEAGAFVRSVVSARASIDLGIG